MLTLGSLFTGIGGIDLAFQRAGFTIAFQVEIDDYCNKVLAKHWPNVTRHRDVREVGNRNLPTVDVLAGGFPCQDISLAGLNRGIKDDTRSGLWFEFRRIISELRPRIVMLENVAAITTNGGLQVIADLASLGYDAEWGIISASNAGAPHGRERWWCVAYPSSIRCANPLRERNSPTQNDDRQTSIGKKYRLKTHMGTSPVVGDRSTTRIASQPVLGRAANGLSRWMDRYSRWPARKGQKQFEWEATRVAIPENNREARIKALGNAVVPQVVQPIAEAIAAFLKETDTEGSTSATREGEVIL